MKSDRGKRSHRELMKKNVTIAFVALIASAAFAQSMWFVGPVQASPLNAKFEGSISDLTYNDGKKVILRKIVDSDEPQFGVDVTFGSLPARAKHVMIALNAVNKGSLSAFDRFEVFDFNSRAWIGLGASVSVGNRPVTNNVPTLYSDRLDAARFSHDTTGEVWVRAVWNGTTIEHVWVDQLSLVYCN